MGNLIITYPYQPTIDGSGQATFLADGTTNRSYIVLQPAKF